MRFIRDWTCYIVRTKRTYESDLNSKAQIFIEQKEISLAVSEVSISTNQSQQTDAMKNVMCIAALIVSPFIAVGIYAATGNVVAVWIFIGVAVTAAITCFAIVKLVKK